MRSLFLALSLFLFACADDEPTTTIIPPAEEAESFDERPQSGDDDSRRDSDGSGDDGGGDTGGTTVTDADGDGYTSAVDCNDSNANVYPGAPETVGDGIDQNCDGSDSSALYTWYYDADGDGYGLSSWTVSSESRPTNYAALSGDCNDLVAGINPGASEGSVADGVDNDCDGLIDEGITAPEEPDGSTDGDAKTVNICVIDSWADEYDLYVNDLHGSDANWIVGGTVFLTESDADGCRTFETACNNELELQGYGDDTEFWGDYISGTCQGDTAGWLVEDEATNTCSSQLIKIDGNEVTEFYGTNLFYHVTCE